MRIRIAILSLLLLCGSTGCPLLGGIFTAKEIVWGLGGIAYISKELSDRKHEKKQVELTERGLDLTERGLDLQERDLKIKEAGLK